jgi:GNAT superfamily N-acetyltransferase
LGIKVTDWDGLFNEMNEETGNYAYVRFTYTNNVVGFIQFKPIELSNWFFNVKMGFIREFWISKDYRKNGNGTDLLQLAEAYFIENGLYKSILTTDIAHKFYEANGYIKDANIVAKNKDDVYIKDLKYIN